MEGAPRVVALVGATATGKTDLAIRAALAAKSPVEILGLDSRQLYRDLDVGTGKPDALQRRVVPHHLLDLLGPDESPDAMWYRERAEEAVQGVVSRGAVPLLVGGSGFYLRALREGFHDLPGDTERRAEVRARVAALSDDEVRAELGRVDRPTLERLHPNDRYRLGRALEIAWLSGEPPSALEARFVPRPILGARFDLFLLGVERTVLHERIARRTHAWMDGGWPEEARALLDRGVDPQAPALRTLGYREVVEWILGGARREEAVERITVRTRRYARQQETWFRKESGAKGLGLDEEAVLVRALEGASP